MRYYLSLGSNIKPRKNIRFAENELKKIFKNWRTSSLHKTKAEGFEGDDFLNSVVFGEADISFDDLNKKLKSIEDAAERNRKNPKFSSRTLDIDIVLQIDENDEIIFESDEIEKYSFVSMPLKELL
jgi:2-amino-4-hydroxy-6-hydroxymethyldihydropteridine diphosphokinase